MYKRQLDEPSLGLAPLLVKDIFGFIKRINDELGLTVLVIEQNARRALEVADHGYIMEQGRIVLEGSAQELRENPDVKEFYLGLGDSGNRKSFRDVKHYNCLLYTSDAADERSSVDLGGRRIIKKKTRNKNKQETKTTQE